MNIHSIPAASRYTAKHHWLTSTHLFSFADYYDADNIHFGALRVFNDDMIDGHQGFGMHPHSNMEIITLVLSGQITHEDTHGGNAIVSPGGVQVMSAGSGLQHSEMNRGDEAVHLYQIWIHPRREGIVPRHDERDMSTIAHDTLVPIVSGFNHDVLKVDAEVVVYRGVFDTETTLTHTPYATMKNVFIYVTRGGVSFSTGEILQAGDQARITDAVGIQMTFSPGTEIVLIDVGD